MRDFRYILKRLNESLNKLKSQEAARGGSINSPIELANEIKEYESFIQLVEEALDANKKLREHLEYLLFIPKELKNPIETLLSPILGEKADSMMVTEPADEKIEQCEKEFRRELLHFMHWVAKDIVQSAGGGFHLVQVYTNLRDKCRDWLNAIQLRLDKDNYKQAEEVWDRIKDVHTPNDLTRGPDDSDISDLIDKIAKLTRIALR